MTALRHRWQRSAAIAATAGAAFLGTAIAATPAQAHSKEWNVDCYAVQLDLTNYSKDKDNSLTVTAGGKTLVSENFKGEFHKKVDLPKHDKELAVEAKVVAGDDSKYSWSDSKSSPVCETESPAPSPTESESTTPTPPSSTPSQSEAPQPSAPESSSSAPASEPQGGGEDLAETGSSSNTPMLVGIAAAVVIVGGGLVAFARKRRTNS